MIPSLAAVRSRRQSADERIREIVPSPPEQAIAPACDHAQCTLARLSWARLLKRVFDIDVEHCPNRGSSLKSIAAIEDPPVIVKILAHLGLPTRAPATLPGAAIRFIPDNLSRKPVANASRRCRSL